MKKDNNLTITEKHRTRLHTTRWGQEHRSEPTPRSDFDPSSESAGDNVQYEQEDFNGLR